MASIGHSWEFENQTFWEHLPSDVTIEVWVESIRFSPYSPASWGSPAEGGDLEGYDIGDVHAYDGETPIPLTNKQQTDISNWAYGRKDLEEKIYQGDYFD